MADFPMDVMIPTLPMTHLSPTAVIVGAFQPPSRADLARVAAALARFERVLVVLTGGRRAASPRHPWTPAEREALLRAALEAGQNARISVVSVRDRMYQPRRWADEVRSVIVSSGFDPGAIALVAADAEAAGFARRGLRFARRLIVPPAEDAETVRAAYFRGDDGWRSAVPAPVADTLVAFCDTAEFNRLAEEQRWMDGVRAAWAHAPYPPIFVTADCVVVASGHLLLIRRGHAPGAELWALPGGFVEQDELAAEAALRELVEETGINVDVDALRARVAGSGVFDHPLRSLRGRGITHGLFVDLGDVALPALQAADDASEAEWVALKNFDALEPCLAEDHADIIRFFIEGD